MKQKRYVIFISTIIIISAFAGISIFSINQQSKAQKNSKPIVTDVSQTKVIYPKEQLNKTIKNGKPTLLLFTSQYCHDCKLLKPVISELEKEYKKQVNFMIFDIQSKDPVSKEAFKQYKIFGVPIVVITDNKGNKLKPITGFQKKDKFKKELDSLLKK